MTQPVPKTKLKGNQKKLEANKNNKIDAQDFALLRKKSTVKQRPTLLS